MNQKDMFDEKLFNHFKNNNQIPKKIDNAIKETNLKNEKRNMFSISNLKKIAIAGISVAAVSTGVVFAENVIHNIFNDNKGVDTAIESGYIYEIPNVPVISKGTEVRATKMIMDDYTLDMTLVVKFDENIDVTGIEHFQIPDLLITDESNRILYSHSRQRSIDFCNSKGISSDYESIKAIKTNTSSSLFVYNADVNNVVLSINLSAFDEKFPLSKKIYLSFNNMVLSGNNKNYTITGDWDININVPEKFLNRESILYKASNCNNENVYKDSIKAEVYETGMNFEMTMYWGDYEEWHSKSEEMRKENVLSSPLIKQETSYVMNEKGEKFYPLQSTSTDGGYSFNTDGKLIKWESFGLTKFDLTDRITVFLTTIDDSQIVIELNRV